MKKIFVCLMLVSCLFALAGCKTKITDEFGNERIVGFGLVEVKALSEQRYERNKICYDPATKICYLKAEGYHSLAICPYYIIGEDGAPEIAVYGVNYK